MMAEPSQKPLVYIVIVNWNGWQDTVNCIESLEHVDYSDFVTLVVDNGSTNDSVTQISSAFPELLMLNLESNLGFTGGSNRGIQIALAAGADYVLLLNNDVIVDPPFLSTMVEIMERDRSIGALNPKIYYLDAPKQDLLWAVGGKANLWLAGTGNRGRDEVDNGQYEEAVELPFGTGCCLLMSRHALEIAGLLDDDYFIYFEDADWSYRVRALGLSVQYTPRARVWHAVNASSKIPDRGQGTLSPVVHFLVARNHLWFVRTHTSIVQKFVAYPAYFVRRILFYSGVFVVLGRWTKLKELWRGLAAGLRPKPGWKQ